MTLGILCVTVFQTGSLTEPVYVYAGDQANSHNPLFLAAPPPPKYWDYSSHTVTPILLLGAWDLNSDLHDYMKCSYPLGHLSCS